jgi:hypothetical protein
LSAQAESETAQRAATLTFPNNLLNRIFTSLVPAGDIAHGLLHEAPG